MIKKILQLKIKKTELIFILILVLGIFLRIYDLGGESLWLDEGISVNTASKNLTDIIKISFSKKVATPLYHIILHYWMNFLGDTEFSVRFLSVIFGSLAIFMIYKVGSLMFDKKTGILSSLILALSAFNIRFSQETRMYSLITFLTLLSMYFFIKFLREINYAILISYISSSILLIYAHYVGLFIIITQNIYFFTLYLLNKKEHKHNLKIWILLQGILIILFLPWYYLRSLRTFIKMAGVAKSNISLYPLWISLLEFSGSKILLLIFLMLAVFSAVNYKKIKAKISLRNLSGYINLTNIKEICLLLLWIFIPIILASSVSGFFTRYIIGASPAFYLLVSKGIRSINHKYFKSVTIGIILFFSFVSIGLYYAEVNKESWKDTANYINENAEPEDLVFVFPDYTTIPLNYYLKRIDIIMRATSNINAYIYKVKEFDRVWIVVSRSGLGRETWIKEELKDYSLVNHLMYTIKDYISHEKHTSIELYLFEKHE
jgi:4-amino-4-deoxy-L-arabinose transferase-like glycosyltransferase